MRHYCRQSAATARGVCALQNSSFVSVALDHPPGHWCKLFLLTECSTLQLGRDYKRPVTVVCCHFGAFMMLSTFEQAIVSYCIAKAESGLLVTQLEKMGLQSWALQKLLETAGVVC